MPRINHAVGNLVKFITFKRICLGIYQQNVWANIGEVMLDVIDGSLP